MAMRLKNASDWTRVRVMLFVLTGVLACVLIAAVYSYFSYSEFHPEEQALAVRNSILLPMLLAVPLLTMLGFKLLQLEEVNAELAHAANIDMLTGGLNRRAFTELIHAELAKSKTERADGALLIIDADYFKQINDSLGHDGGDAALIAIAECIRATIRADDFMGRVGGEEFAVFMRGASLPESVLAGERIVAAVQQLEFEYEGVRRNLAVSVGGAAFVAADMKFRDLYRAADERLYQAKEAGRNRAVVLPFAQAA